MNKYESVIIVSDKIKKEERNNLINKIRKYIEDNEGKITEVEDLGIKKLAYTIQKHEYGYYVIFYFKCEPQIISGLERLYRIADEVLKFITVRNDS